LIEHGSTRAVQDLLFVEHRPSLVVAVSRHGLT
jgi:hypothetical protein